MRQINEVIIHCSATRAEWMKGSRTSAKVSEIRRWHKSKTPPWKDIGYHYLIDRDGTLAKGRPVEQTGAHVKGRNKGTIGVCLIGGHGSAETDQFADNFTAAQRKTLIAFLKDMRATYGDVLISGHNQYAAKACPGFNVPEWLASIDEPKRAPKPAFSWADFFAAIFQGFRK